MVEVDGGDDGWWMYRCMVDVVIEVHGGSMW